MATGRLAWLLTMMLTLPGKLDLVYRSAAGMRNRFSELEYRSDEHPSRTVRHAGTWLKERVPWGRDMGGGLGRDDWHRGSLLLHLGVGERRGGCRLEETRYVIY